MKNPTSSHPSRPDLCPSREQLQLLLDDELGARQVSAVSRHLDTCEECRQTLEQTASEPALWSDAQCFLSDADIEAATRIADIDELAAEVIQWLGPSDDPDSLGRVGRYEVTGIVGAGSMGVVLKAHEAQLKRYVAIKVLRPMLAHSGAARKRFAREARAAAAVNHQHVVPIYGVDEFNGLPYLVMQYVGGQSLASRIQQTGPLQVTEVVRIALQTARALAAAHEQGLVHRDIKPANILLENGVERSLVTDFGLARVADEANLTRSGIITGTPQFMAPEQARGEQIEPRSDLFSLGATMYAMCAGRPPFRADSVFGLLKKICDTEPRPLRQINAEVPAWLEAFIQKLLSKEPMDRFTSAGEVAELLAAELAFLQNPTSGRVPARRWMPALTRSKFARWEPLRSHFSNRWVEASIATAIVLCGSLLLRPPPTTAGRPASTADSSLGSASVWSWATPDRPEVFFEELTQIEQQIFAPVEESHDAWPAEIEHLKQALRRLEDDSNRF